MNAPLHYRVCWQAIGLLLLLAVMALSLLPISQPLPVSGGDRIGHLLAYGVLMYWWGMVQPASRLHWLLMLAGLGLALEGIQGLLPHRYLEWQDAVANLTGVLTGLVLLHTPLAGLLGRLDTRLRNRFDTGAP